MFKTYPNKIHIAKKSLNTYYLMTRYNGELNIDRATRDHNINESTLLIILHNCNAILKNKIFYFLIEEDAQNALEQFIMIEKMMK